MTTTHNDDELISYDELYKILFDKFKATHDEIHYWVTNHYHFINPLVPIASDLPYVLKDSLNYHIVKYPICPLFHFYFKSHVDQFNPSWNRFVYIKDLTAKRNWYDYKIDDSHSKIIETLKKANETGILRFYDFDSDEFTIHRTHKPFSNTVIPDKKHFWAHTVEGKNYLQNPDSFFHIRDILNIERIFFNRPREDCLKELSQLYGSTLPISSSYGMSVKTNLSLVAGALDE